MQQIYKPRLATGSILLILLALLAGCTNSPAPSTVSNGTPGTNPGGGTSGTQFPVPCGSSCANGGGQGTPKLSVVDRRFPASDNPLLDHSPILGELVGALWSACLAQQPDLTQGIAGYVADQCARVPSLANGGESADGRQTILQFATGLKWSDGTDLTATDFAFFLALATDPQFGPQPAFAEVDHVKVVDATTLQIFWKVPYAPYLDALTHLIPMPTFAFPGIYSQAGGYNASAATSLLNNVNFTIELPVTNGPFGVVNGTTGSNVNLALSPLYHSQTFQPPMLKRWQLAYAANLSNAVTLFNQKKADLVQGLDETDLGGLSGVAAGSIQMTPQNVFTYLAFNQRAQAPNATHHQGSSIFAGSTGKLVRQALVEALDRCAALNTLTTALGTSCGRVTTDENTTALALDANPTVHLPGLNVADAQHLLDQAGLTVAQSGANTGKRAFPDGQPVMLTFAVANNPALMAVANAAAQGWASNLALTCNVVPTDVLDATFAQGGVLATGNYDIALAVRNNGGDASTEFDFVQAANIPSAANPTGTNSMGINDPQLDAQITAAAQETSFAKRAFDDRQLQAYLAAQLVDEPLYVRQRVALVAPTFGGYQPSTIPPGDEWNAAGWYMQP